jgi:hypothetical protein
MHERTQCTDTPRPRAQKRSPAEQELARLGVLPPDLDALKLAISEDGASRDKKLGTKVAGWIGRMVSKAASGVWTVGTSTAVSVSSEAH